MNRLTGIPCISQLFPAQRDGDQPSSFYSWDETLDRVEFQFTLHNDPSLIYPLVTYLRDRVAAFGLRSETLEKHVGIALEEALLNALYHGNLELSSAELRQASDELLEYG